MHLSQKPPSTSPRVRRATRPRGSHRLVRKRGRPIARVPSSRGHSRGRGLTLDLRAFPYAGERVGDDSAGYGGAEVQNVLRLPRRMRVDFESGASTQARQLGPYCVQSCAGRQGNGHVLDGRIGRRVAEWVNGPILRRLPRIRWRGRQFRRRVSDLPSPHSRWIARRERARAHLIDRRVARTPSAFGASLSLSAPAPLRWGNLRVGLHARSLARTAPRAYGVHRAAASHAGRRQSRRTWV